MCWKDGPLRSTVPPWTFPAWSSFLTGKNPGKHGIFDFTRPRPGTYELEFVNGGRRRAPSFWQLLSQAGRQVISISIPCTFPPEPVNGVMISGFDAAGDAHVDARGMHPPGLYDELLQHVGRHPVGAFVANVNDINRGRPEAALQQVLDTVPKKAATAKYLLKTKPWDCFMILFGESDGSGHQFWRYCDPASPLYTDRPAMRDALLQVYQALDRQLGELLELAPPDAVVLMMSDHGFGGVGNWVVYPNCFLREKGLLRFRPRKQGWTRLLNALKLWGVSNLPGWVQKPLHRFAGRFLGRYEAGVRFAMIDWEGTEAYFDENPYFPAAWVNVKGRRPRGTVEPGRHYEEVRDRLIGELEAWRHPETGAPVVERAYRREDVYTGPYADEAPDVVVKWALHRGYSYAFKMSSGSPDLVPLRPVDPAKPEHFAFFTNKSGTHRDDGIFLAHGPGVRPGEVAGARITDLAPTILSLLGVPVPDDMDGRVLADAFPGLGLAGQQEAAGALAGSEAVYSAEDEERMAERLRSLGYIE